MEGDVFSISAFECVDANTPKPRRFAGRTPFDKRRRRCFRRIGTPCRAFRQRTRGFRPHVRTFRQHARASRQRARAFRRHARVSPPECRKSRALCRVLRLHARTFGTPDNASGQVARSSGHLDGWSGASAARPGNADGGLGNVDRLAADRTRGPALFTGLRGLVTHDPAAFTEVSKAVRRRLSKNGSKTFERL